MPYSAISAWVQSSASMDRSNNGVRLGADLRLQRLLTRGESENRLAAAAAGRAVADEAASSSATR